MSKSELTPCTENLPNGPCEYPKNHLGLCSQERPENKYLGLDAQSVNYEERFTLARYDYEWQPQALLAVARIQERAAKDGTALTPGFTVEVLAEQGGFFDRKSSTVVVRAHALLPRLADPLMDYGPSLAIPLASARDSSPEGHTAARLEGHSCGARRGFVNRAPEYCVLEHGHLGFHTSRSGGQWT